MSEPGAIEVRSYRTVFDLERRIYRIDTLRLNPGGIPIRGVLYGVAVTLSIVLLGTLPLIGGLLALLPWYMRDIALPVGLAALLAVVRIEGRAFHLAAHALGRHAFAARRLHGLEPCSAPAPGRRWHPHELLMLADGSDSRLRRMRFSGAGAALIAVAHSCSSRGVHRGGVTSRLGVHPAAAARPLPRARVLKVPSGVHVDVYRD